MTFEEKLDKLIVLLESLIEQNNNFNFNKIELPVKNKTDENNASVCKYTLSDIRELVKLKKDNGISPQVLKETLNKIGYSALSEVKDTDLDLVYSKYLSLGH